MTVMIKKTDQNVSITFYLIVIEVIWLITKNLETPLLHSKLKLSFKVNV